MNPTKIIVYTFLVILALCTGTMLYWLYGPDKVLDIHNGPVPIRPSVQDRDQLVFLIVNYCKLQDHQGTVRRSLISDTVRIMLPLQTDTGPKTCQQVDVPLLIPKAITPDTYHVHIDVDYQINPFKKVTESFDSQSFVVK